MSMNKPSPRLAILRAQLAAEARELQAYRDAMAGPTWVGAAPAPDADSLPLPPTYDQDLDAWLISIDHAQSRRHYEMQPDGAVHDVEPTADAWHSELPTVAGVYIAAAYDLCVTQRRHWNGRGWSQNWEVTDDAPLAARRRGTASVHSDVKWLRLIEADKPAETAAPAAATHSVCIKAHHNLAGAMNHVGDVIEYGPSSRHVPECWLPCDKDGWVSHTPTADSVCPVPAGVNFKVRFRNGHVANERCDYWGSMGGQSAQAEIVAWCPTGATA